MFDCSFLRNVLAPTHLVMAGEDEYGNLAKLRERLPDLPAHVTAEEIPGVGHFFEGKTLEVESRAHAWCLAR